MKKIKCPNCLEKNPAESRNCKICGAELRPLNHFDPKNFVLPENSKYSLQESRSKLVFRLKTIWAVVFIIAVIFAAVVFFFVLGPRIPEFAELFKLLKT